MNLLTLSIKLPRLFLLADRLTSLLFGGRDLFLDVCPNIGGSRSCGLGVCCVPGGSRQSFKPLFELVRTG